MSAEGAHRRDGLLVGIETGGTKTLCAVAAPDAPDAILAQQRIPTTDPAATLTAVNGWIADALDGRAAAGVGIAAFGPIDLDPSSPDFTRLTDTPKLAWVGASLLEGLPVLAGAPLRAVSDVTGAAIGERAAGAGQGLDRLAYVTIGTGVGAGVLLDGRPIVGSGYPELGHILVRRHRLDAFAGRCPYHGDCLEGLACGPALQDRYGVPAERLSAQQQAETAAIVGDYAAQLAWLLRIGYGAQRVVFGGGVLQIPGLLEALRARLAEIAGGPIASPDGGEFVTLPGLGGAAGIRGALELAAAAAAAAAS